MDEASYADGRRAAWLAMLGQCLRALRITDRTDPLVALEYLVVERQKAIQMLRRLCADHGDTAWEDTLHLADILDKHLGRHLDAREG